MFWVLSGLGLGWWLVVLLGLYSGAEKAWSGEADDAQLRGIAARANAIWITWIISAVVVFGLALGDYFDLFGSVLYGMEGFLLSRKVLQLATGFAVGLWASRYRAGIGVCARRFYAALLGVRGKSAWALQSAVALAALAVFVVAADPELLEHLESIKAGEVEAKFSSVSTATREAHITLNPLQTELEINAWIDFVGELEHDSTRNAATYLFDESEIKLERIYIRNLLFERYLGPLAVFLACLDHHELLAAETHRPSFVALAVSLRNALTQEQRSAFLDEKRLSDLLEMIGSEIVNIDELIQLLPESQQKDCRKFKFQNEDPMTITSVRERIFGVRPWIDIRAVAGWSETGVAGNGNVPEDPYLREIANLRTRLKDEARRDAAHLKACIDPARKKLDGAEDERQFKLSFIDPYTAYLVGDMVALALGHSEELKFLRLAKDEYPTETDFFHPGLVNLYYQLGTLKNHVEAPWPLDERIHELDHAMDSIDYVIAKTRAKAREVQASGDKPPASQPPNLGSCNRWPKDLKFEITPDRYNEILNEYFYVKLLTISRFLETYYTRSLAGDTLGDHYKLQWASLYRELESILNSNGDAVKLESIGVSDNQIPAADLPFWRSAVADMVDEDPFEANVAMALSSVMLTESNFHRAPSDACAVARHYLSNATASIKLIHGFDAAERDHFQGFIEQVEARIRTSCT